MAALYHHTNQMLFNLDVPATSANLTAKYRGPEPIVIERYNGLQSAPNLDPGQPAFNFSSISEENLSLCMQLAKRDLKKQKEDEAEDELLRKQQNREKQGKMTRNGDKGKTIPSRDIGRQKQPNKRQQINISETKTSRQREHLSKFNKALITEIRKRNEKSPPPPGGVSRLQPELLNMPVTTMSPPTRDTDPYRKASAQEEKLLQEISKCRRDISYCVDQIRKLEVAAKRGKLLKNSWKPIGAEDMTEEQIQKRQMTRLEEQGSRFSRMLYDLQLQVKELQEDVTKLHGSRMKNKKTRLLQRLATAHRGAVKVFQTFVTQLPDYNIEQGLPKSFQELNLLVKQLSLCCAQLEVTGEAGVPESVVTLLKDVAELNEFVKNQIESSPPRERVGVSPPRGQQDKSQINRRLFDGGTEVGEVVPKYRIQSEFKSLMMKNKQTNGILKEKSSQGNHIAFEEVSHEDMVRGKRDGQHREDQEPTSPDRKAILQAGMAALIRAGQNPLPSSRGQQRRPSEVPPLDLPMTPKNRQPPIRMKPQPNRQNINRNVPVLPLPSKQKSSVLLPTELQDRRRQLRGKAVDIDDAHFAEPTLSSRMKEIGLTERGMESPRTRSPRRASSPRMRSPNRAPTYYSQPDSPFDTVASEITRQVKLDRQSHREGHLPPSPRASRGGLARPTSGRRSVKIAESTEQKLRSRLQPLIAQAQEPNPGYEQYEEPLYDEEYNYYPHPSHLDRRPSQQSVQSVEMNADTMAEMVFQEVMEDTARELSRLEEEGYAEEEALEMIHLPDVSAMIQRIQEMESEEEEIRSRWATLVYEDEQRQPYRTAFFDAAHNDQPATPPPIEVAATSTNQQAGRFPQYEERNIENADMIVFTKPRTTVPVSRLQLSRRASDPEVANLYKEEVEGAKDEPLFISLPKKTLSNIYDYSGRFQEHLKKTSTQAVGRFNPWQIVEEVADEILSTCTLEVGKELEDINNDIVNHVYHSEFTRIPSDTRLAEDGAYLSGLDKQTGAVILPSDTARSNPQDSERETSYNSD